MTCITQPRCSARTRDGFTLVELMVVVAIMGVLIALTAGATMSVITGQRERNTENTVRKIYGLLEQQWKAVYEEASKKERVPTSSPVYSLAGNDPVRAQVIWTKFRLMQEFPTSYAEIQQAPLASYGLLPKRSYIDALQRGSPVAGGAAESSACLLLALTASGRKGSGADADILASNEVADTNGDGIKEIVDAWNMPVAFFRFPTGNAELQSLAPSGASFLDPQDNSGRLMVPGWWTSYHTQFEGLCHSVTNAAGTGPASYYLVPVVTSSGKDRDLGLTFPTMAASGTGSYDNINSYTRPR